MDNQHRHITGYRELSAEEIALMNEIKAKAADVGALVERMRNSRTSEERKAGVSEPFDQRWVSLGQTQLQQGFMALTRAVAKPTTF